MIRSRLLWVRVNTFTTFAGRLNKIKWFYATDVPKTSLQYNADNKSKVPRVPTKFMELSAFDSDLLEKEYQRLQNVKSISKPEEPNLIPVNEDSLFHVDVNKMELSPTYWKGPKYEVRRGLWFQSLKSPLPYDITILLEYCRQVWLNPVKFPLININKNDLGNIIFNFQSLTDVLQDKNALSETFKKWDKLEFIDQDNVILYPKSIFSSTSNDNSSITINSKDDNSVVNYFMNYFDDTFITKTIRVYRNIKKMCHSKSKDNTNLPLSSTLNNNNTSTTVTKSNSSSNYVISNITNSITRMSDMISLEWKNILGNTMNNNNQNNTNNNNEDDEMLQNTLENDFDHNNNKDRKIVNLYFCVHGIGQTLGKRYKYFNFTHTVNQLRNNMKKVYSESDRLKELNKENGFDDWKTNSTIQVIPIAWRDEIGFGMGEPKMPEHSNLPTLDQITLDGVENIRRLIGDVALDILLYRDPYYQDLIINQVKTQMNYVFDLFMKNNPAFDGNIHLIGHSLGSIILFDMLNQSEKYKLKFKVKNYFCLGAQIGVFKLIERTNISGPISSRYKSILGLKKNDDKSDIQYISCDNLYNIFHVCDPIAYRLEPLIAHEMSKYRYQVMPHWTEKKNSTNVKSMLPDIPAAGSDFFNDFFNSYSSKESTTKPIILKKEIADKLKSLNSTGRIDFALPRSALNVDAISAIKAHVGYFEDLDVARFILNETLKKTNPVDDIIVTEQPNKV